ncbi:MULTISPECIES: hypothetical protein [Candidatus Nitrosocaldus]|jgi:hypothetical protein|uniref:Uncharacterized protein n=1 Tax=Candidatus Nitrosocaldus cavascurensis TaxID=2058097 RepID=A0A2K5ARX7_9ARCH|nr:MULTISPECIES: hypothetical protein [Candidatus Nitrosocaldus]SPC34369.1 protein of unknown function [Candidatus Nitrosocaldus cavascurensis]
MNYCSKDDDVVTVDSDGKITIRVERMEVEHIYPCIFNDRVLLFIKDEDGMLNCYEVEDEYLKSQIMDNPSHNSIVRILQQIIDNEKV